MVFFANAVAGILTGQEMIRGQVALRHTGLLGVPMVNVENACASASSAFYLAVMAVASGPVEVALAVGSEKLTHEDRRARSRRSGRRWTLSSQLPSWSAVGVVRVGGLAAARAGRGGPAAASARSSWTSTRRARARYMERSGGDPGGLRAGRGQEPPARGAEPLCAVPHGGHGRGGARQPRDRAAAHPADVLADRRRGGGARRLLAREGAAARGAGPGPGLLAGQRAGPPAGRAAERWSARPRRPTSRPDWGPETLTWSSCMTRPPRPS